MEFVIYNLIVGFVIMLFAAVSVAWIVIPIGIFLVPPVVGFVLSLELGGWKAFWIQVGVFIVSLVALPVLFWIWYIVLYIMGLFSLVIFLLGFFVPSSPKFPSEP